MIELLLVAKRFNLDCERLVLNVFALADTGTAYRDDLLLAVHYLSHYEIGVFDALHAAFSRNEPIISSGRVFDKLGLERIALEVA